MQEENPGECYQSVPVYVINAMIENYKLETQGLPGVPYFVPRDCGKKQSLTAAISYCQANNIEFYSVNKSTQ